jgi:hypothetical protein
MKKKILFLILTLSLISIPIQENKCGISNTINYIGNALWVNKLSLIVLGLSAYIFKKKYDLPSRLINLQNIRLNIEYYSPEFSRYYIVKNLNTLEILLKKINDDFWYWMYTEFGKFNLKCIAQKKNIEDQCVILKDSLDKLEKQVLKNE